MSYLIKSKTYELDKVKQTLQKQIYTSRFSAEISWQGSNLAISNIRLRVSKDYCGNHPGACVRGGSHRKAKYLEGADWVEFNDTINNVLDNLQISADVSSSVCVIRQGRKRRICYAKDMNRQEWEKQGSTQDYFDNCGNSPIPSRYPEGTPGIYNIESSPDRLFQEQVK